VAQGVSPEFKSQHWKKKKASCYETKPSLGQRCNCVPSRWEALGSSTAQRKEGREGGRQGRRKKGRKEKENKRREKRRKEWVAGSSLMISAQFSLP
jgi:hypothetical protein